MKISILIPCYNAERWVAAAIESALAQTCPDTEVLVVDDGSTDGSLNIIKSFGSRIRWETGPNRGGNVARNRLLELASGKWLQYLDADDYLQPDKIERQLAGAEHGAADVLYSPVILEHWKNGAVDRREATTIPQPHDPGILLARWRLPQTGAVLWRRRAVVSVGGWRPDQPCCQEHELYLRLLQAGCRFVYSPHSGAIYRQWSETTVCRRNPLESLRRRLQIVRRLEEHLRDQNSLTAERRCAIAFARAECARALYQYDPSEARLVAQECRRNCPNFRLPSAPCFSFSYRLAHRVGGFSAAEWIAASTRHMRKSSPAHGRPSSTKQPTPDNGPETQVLNAT